MQQREDKQSTDKKPPFLLSIDSMTVAGCLATAISMILYFKLELDIKKKLRLPSTWANGNHFINKEYLRKPQWISPLSG